VDEDKYALDRDVRDILDTLTDLFKRAGSTSQVVAGIFGISPSDVLALFKLEDGITMKELAQRMACDASYVTSVADSLEKHGLIRRESGQRDRRVKNLVITPDGLAAKERMTQELAVRMPWATVLDDTERRCFLTLLKKMVRESGEAATPDETGSSAP
jgi:DNA-binding MarR family transcriptional regulator